jgi:hypothetical protein
MYWRENTVVFRPQAGRRSRWRPSSMEEGTAAARAHKKQKIIISDG